MPGQLVNACYDPSRNDITFPAAILQAPFYSLGQSNSENFGGIGAVIAHEISHGFDNNGAKFDEFGNLKNWWQESDYKEFKRLTQAMIDEFDGRDYAGGKVNGKLIVSENIADLGGMAAALSTAQQDDNVDLKAFFTNWGRIWRQKARPEYAQLLLSSDVHAPNRLRANIQPQNFDEWYTTFDVQPGDGMYLEPERRVAIW
nr:M13-type metalloendopeptidase [Lacticaseibacillus thailandensis]